MKENKKAEARKISQSCEDAAGILQAAAAKIEDLLEDIRDLEITKGDLEDDVARLMKEVDRSKQTALEAALEKS